MNTKCNVCFWTGSFCSIKDITGTSVPWEQLTCQCYLPHVGKYGNRKTSSPVENSHSSVQDHETSYQDLIFKWFWVKKKEKKGTLGTVHTTFLWAWDCFKMMMTIPFFDTKYQIREGTRSCVGLAEARVGERKGFSPFSLLTKKKFT